VVEAHLIPALSGAKEDSPAQGEFQAAGGQLRELGQSAQMFPTDPLR
jgi:hypothetical protein